MACGGCGKNKSNFEDRPMFANGVPNKPMQQLMGRNGNKFIDNGPETKEVERRKQNILLNLGRAAVEQKAPFKWMKDGLSGLIKCLEGDTLYDDDGIKSNRQTCKECEYSTKDDKGNLTLKSQCMGPDPEQNGAPCGCFLTCKTQSGKCPLKKWTSLTIKGV